MKLVRDVLRHHGHATLEAVTGDEGFRLALEPRPDLVLMDIQLPDTDGVEVLRRMRQERALDAIPVIAVSASVMPDDHAKIVALRLRRLRHQADRPEAVHGDGAPPAGERPGRPVSDEAAAVRPAAKVLVVDDVRAQRQAARRPARGERLPHLHRRLGRRRRSSGSPASGPTWCCST